MYFISIDETFSNSKLFNPISYDNQKILKVRFIYLTTINKQVLQLIFFVGTDASRGGHQCARKLEQTEKSQR